MPTSDISTNIQYIFSYGTLQKDKVQYETFGRLLKGHKDVLRSYHLAHIEIKEEQVLIKSEQRYHPIAVFSNDDHDLIEGVVFEISASELLLADNYEVDNYKRAKLKLASGREAWVYIQK